MRKWQSAPAGVAYTVWRNTRRLIIFVVGVTVLLLGVILVFLPGPAFLVIPAGLAILATEFVWARTLLKRVKASATSAVDAARGRNLPAYEGQGFFRRCWFRCRHAWDTTTQPFRKGYVDPEADLPKSE